ncbi:MAG: acyl-CoA/acyl-ACP dehydrogenase [Proteobacteria bacterium]|nr:acyl-CoA/acyl-ACP dehydrogenase [Pseudomonadota bacterium]
MDLEFSEEQEVLREMVRGVLAEYAPLDTVRALEDDPTGFPEELWKQLGELGLLGIAIPEEHGGAGQSLIEAAILYEEIGRALAPSPHFVSCVLGAGALLRAGSDDQKAEWLPKLAGGEAVVTPAWLEPRNGYGPEGVQMRARIEGDRAVLSGTKWHVHYASAATRLLVLARTGDAPEDVDLFLVDPKAQGVALSQQLNLAADAQYEVRFDEVAVPLSDRVGGAGGGWRAFDEVMLDGAILAAAQAAGGAARALELTVDYAKERVQFDKPLGAFQSIAHYLADAATAVAGGTTLVYEAAWARSEGRSVARLAPMAKLFLCQTYRDVTAMCQQVWGGVGFTIEYDIQLYFRRAKQLQLSWWDTRTLEERVAATVLD